MSADPAADGQAGRLRIVCGTDLLPRSEFALERAGMMTARLGAELTVVHAVSVQGPPDTLRQAMHRAHRRMKALTTQPRWQHGPAPTVLTRAGNPPQVICEAAQEVEARLVVLGADCTRIARDLLAGTIAERVLKRLQCPVLIVRRVPWRTYRNVLLLLGRDDPQAMMTAAGRLVLHAEASASVVHESITEIERIRRRLKERVPELLVIGAVRRGWLRRTLLGDSITHALAIRELDVLIVPDRRVTPARMRSRPARRPEPWPLWRRRRSVAVS